MIKIPLGVAIGFLLCIAALTSCSRERADVAPPRQSPESSVNESVVSAAIGRVLESALGYPTPKGPVRWPEDSLPHPSFRAETWQLMAVLEDVDGGQHSVLQQLDRIGVHDADVLNAPVQDSSWRFRDVMRGSLHIASDSEPRRDWQSVQRLALGLASTELVGAATSGARIHVGPNSLHVSVLEDFGKADLTGTHCPMQFLMTMPDVLRLEFNQEHCAEGTSSGPLRIVTSRSLPVEGVLDDGRQVRGTGWVRQAFGELPDFGSPIVFDTALVEIDAMGLLVISRSKRRSGRGPVTLTAHWHGQSANPIDDLVWRAEEADKNDVTIPSRWQLQSASNQLDVILEPVSNDVWVDGPAGAFWRGAVLVRGKHTGLGFVEVQPVAASVSRE